MSLLDMPADIVQQLGETLVGEAEAAGLRGVSVVARQVATLGQVCKGLLPLVATAWTSLSHQTPEIFSQLGISEILHENKCGYMLGDQPYYGPINLQNHQAPTLRKHSPGLHALGRVERFLLQEYLRSPNGPFGPLPQTKLFMRQLRAPMPIKVMVAVEKHQFFWRSPSPVWRCVPGCNRLEPIEMVRELLHGRCDRGIQPDAELTSLLDNHVKQEAWPYGHCNRNTWWGFRKLVSERWTSAQLQAKLHGCRQAAGVCLYCMESAGQRCYHRCCATCCQSQGLPCHVHQQCSMSARTKRQKRRRSS